MVVNSFIYVVGGVKLLSFRLLGIGSSASLAPSTLLNLRFLQPRFHDCSHN